MFSIEELEEIMFNGFADVECTAGCGESGRVEPDADYKCSECDEGRLVSPLVIMGMI